MSLKITLFLVSFSLYLTINGFFFNDKTMHKIYKDNGVFNIIFQIPQILYSSIITSVINIILKNLSLSEKEILKIKQEKSIKNTVNISKNIEKCIKIKFIIFFLFSLILMLFFWYFISCFCAVYNNTQTILFKDTILSFGLSMLYPFGLSLLPGLARMPSLRAEKKDKKCLYCLSQILALL
jgi:O-antigen ligase